MVLQERGKVTTQVDANTGTASDVERSGRHERALAARIPKAVTCGCGRPALFDLAKREFFCIGCGEAKLCLCVKSPLTSMARPVRVT